MTSFTTQEIHDAIYRAAARIENEPACYNFHRTTVPVGECGTTGCMLGWIAFEMGVSWTKTSEMLATKLPHARGALTDCVFYDYCKTVVGDDYHQFPARAAKAMRAYADAHWPQQTKAISTWVRQPLGDWRDVPYWRPATVRPATPTPNRERVV